MTDTDVETLIARINKHHADNLAALDRSVRRWCLASFAVSAGLFLWGVLGVASGVDVLTSLSRSIMAAGLMSGPVAFFAGPHERTAARRVWMWRLILAAVPVMMLSVVLVFVPLCLPRWVGLAKAGVAGCNILIGLLFLMSTAIGWRRR